MGLAAYRCVQREAVTGDGERFADTRWCRAHRIVQGEHPAACVGPENDPILQRGGAELIECVIDLQIEKRLVGCFDEQPVSGQLARDAVDDLV